MTTINKAEIHQNSFFSGLGAAEIEFITQDAAHAFFTAGDVVCEAQKKADCIYLVLKGSLRVVVDGEAVAELTGGGFLGMMAFLKDQRLRNANVIASSNVDVLIVTYDRLEAFKKNHPDEFLSLIAQISESWVSRIEKRNIVLAQQLKKNKSLINFFCTIFFVTIMLIIATRIGIVYIKEASDTIWVSSIIIACFLISCTIMIRYSHFPLSIFGLTLKNWKKDIFQALYWSLCFLVALLFLKMCYIHFYSRSESLFEFRYLDRSPTTAMLAALLYVPLSFVQEFLTRGVMQGILMEMAETRIQRIRAILIVVLLFSASHLYLPGMLRMSAVIFPGLFWSILYEKQGRRLIGVCVSHAVIGVIFINFIGWGLVFV